MLISVPNDYEKFFFLLKEAVLKNTVRPRQEEELKMTVSRFIRCSPEIEGDSQLGIILFCGIAYVFYGVSKSAIIEFTGMEPEEFNFKTGKFIDNYNQAMQLTPIKGAVSLDLISSHEFDLLKLRTKISLINNYIKFNHRKHNVLFSRKTN